MPYTNIELEVISDVYKHKGKCYAGLCESCPLGIDYETICNYDIAYSLSKNIIENNPELFMEYLL